jgi:hypothetical protein
MRRSAVLFLLVSFAIPLLAQQESQLLIPLTTPDGKRAPNIGVGDLTISEDGKPVKILKIEPNDTPIRVTLSLDNGRGLSQDFVLIRNGAKGFINAWPESMEVTLVSTAPQPRTVVKSTKDRAALLKGIDAIAPATGPGSFIDSITEWVFRIDKDKEKGTYTPVLVALGSTFGEEYVKESDVKEAMNKLPTLGGTVHVLMYNAKAQQGGSSDAQLAVGQGATDRTKGKWEVVANGQRIEAALPELGALVAKMQAGGQYLVTVQRAAGAPPRLGAVGMTAPTGITIGKISLVQPKK